MLDNDAQSKIVEPAVGPRLKRLTGHALIYMVADTISRGSVILLLPLYTRFMAPGEYGILALASMISSFLIMLLSFGGASVVQRFYHQFAEPGERARFLSSFWMFLVVVPGLLIGALYLLVGPVFNSLFHQMPFQPYVALICVAAYLSIAFGTVLPNLYRAREQAGRYFALSLGMMVLTIAFSLLFVVYWGMGAAGALGAQCFAVLLVSVASAVLLFRELSPAWQGQDLRAALKYGLPLVPHLAAHWTLSISDRAILERFVSLSSLGIYSLAYQFGTMLQMLLTSVNQAIAPAFSRAAKDEREKAILARLATYYYLAVAVLTLGIALTAKDVIVLLTPSSYHSAGQLVPYITLGVAAMGFYFVPMNLLSMTAGKTGVIPVITLAAAGTNVGLNLLLVPQMGSWAAAIDTAIGYGVLALLTTAYAQRVIRLGYETSRIVKIIVSALALYGASLLIGDNGPVMNLTTSLLLVALLPFVLWLIRFWSASEKSKLSGVIRTALRIGRYHHHEGLGPIGHP